MSTTNALDAAFNLNQKVLHQLRSGYYPNSKDELLDEIKSFFCPETHSSDAIFKPLSEVIRLRRNVHALTAPIRRLPVDILYEIFSYCARIPHRLLGQREDYVLSIRGSSHRPRCPTLELTWMCSHWRFIIRDYPPLWSSFYIEADLDRISFPRRFEVFREYMALSRQSPLKFCIVIPLESTAVALHDYRILVDNLDRWQHVILDSTTLIGLDSMIPTGHCPNLQSLWIIKQHRHDSQPPPSCVLSSAPSLRTYRDTGTVAWSKSTWFDCSHLTSLNIHVLRAKSIAHFLARFPNLKEFSLGEFEGDGSLITSVLVYQCKIAILNLSMKCLLPRIWERLRLPHLVSLSLYTYASSYQIWKPEYDSFLKEFSSLLLASQCFLQTLKLYNIPTKHSLTFISHHPSITDFVFSSDSIGPDVECSVIDLLDALTIEEHRTSRRKKHHPKPVFLPNFQSFSVNVQTQCLCLPSRIGAGAEPSSFITASILCPSLTAQPEHARVPRLQSLTLGLGSWIDNVGRRFIRERMGLHVAVRDEDIEESAFGTMW
ncbi:hypothetical protein BDP27DRAFT_1331504 [Rhodocollybia butyracea]|uniref:F-box domain-containing protein n=1 Tax=Rhodocollybia butyracea TaxID=206335 RepID=A0A9P5PI03_9AGAR|nr:hypothetical protein BDP27DRAFT_1331504 [Rhodocollybia butyracea]